MTVEHGIKRLLISVDLGIGSFAMGYHNFLLAFKSLDTLEISMEPSIIFSAMLMCVFN